jgi:hypothetical protein
VQNQTTMIEKLNALESRLSSVEKILIIGQQMPISIGQVLAAQKSSSKSQQHSSLQSSPRQSGSGLVDPAKIASGGAVMSKEQKLMSQKQVSPSHSIIAAAVNN